MELQHINGPRARTNLPFSDLVRVGDTCYVAGRIGLGPGGKPPADAREEVRVLMDGLRDVLAAANLEMKHLAQVTIYTPDVSLFDLFNDIYRGYFDGPLPARAFLGSGPLLFGARFELTAIAIAP